MKGQPPLDFEGIEKQPLREFTEKAYLDYSMYVILDRALPQLADGLKPVQRRIIFAMSELSLAAGAKHKKSARTVGDVIGKYHPHGDSACYEAMVLMAQDFSYRYPIVDGQGNWGSTDDPKSFAAMRYTESRLRPYAQVLLVGARAGHGRLAAELRRHARRTEAAAGAAAERAAERHAGHRGRHGDRHPAAQPARGDGGLRAPARRSRSDACGTLQARAGTGLPDRRRDRDAEERNCARLYKTGNGTYRARAVYEVEDGEIVVTALPYQVSGAKVLEQIAGQMRAKKLPMVEDLRDESDHEHPTRLVITPRSNRVDVGQVMAHLFATTDLERSYRVNINVIALDGRPRVFGLRELLAEWLGYRKETVKRRLRYRLEKVTARLHILDGMLIAFLNLDEVIRIVRREDEPKPVLMKRFKLTDPQAEAILETKLRHLAKLEEMKIRGEQKELAEEQDLLEKTLKSAAKLNKLIRDELLADAEKYGDARRTKIVERAAAQAIAEEELVTAEPVTVVLSTLGWVRQARGHDVDPTTLSYKTGDAFQSAALGRSTQQAVFIDSTGRAYSLPAHTLPSARGQGEPLSGRLDPPEGATFAAVAIGEPADKWLLACDAGHGFIAQLEALTGRNRAGKTVFRLPENAKVLPAAPVPTEDGALVVSVNSDGRMLAFPVADLPEMEKGRGNLIFGIPGKRSRSGEELMVAVVVARPGQSVTVHCGDRTMSLTWKELQDYVGARGQRGAVLSRNYRKVTRLTVG